MNAYDTAQRRAQSLSLSLSISPSIYLSIFHSLSRKQAGEALGRELQDPGGDRWCWTRSSKRAGRGLVVRDQRPEDGEEENIDLLLSAFEKKHFTIENDFGEAVPAEDGATTSTEGEDSDDEEEDGEVQRRRGIQCWRAAAVPVSSGELHRSRENRTSSGNGQGVRTPRAATTRRGTRRGGGKKAEEAGREEAARRERIQSKRANRLEGKKGGQLTCGPFQQTFFFHRRGGRRHDRVPALPNQLKQGALRMAITLVQAEQGLRTGSW